MLRGKAIGMLQKLCNHPDLLDLPTDLPGSEDFLPEDFVPKDAMARLYADPALELRTSRWIRRDWYQLRPDGPMAVAKRQNRGRGQVQ